MAQGDNVTNEIKTVVSTDGLDETLTGLKQLATSGDAAVVSTDNLTKKQVSAQGAFLQVAKSVSPVLKAQSDLNREMSKVNAWKQQLDAVGGTAAQYKLIGETAEALTAKYTPLIKGTDAAGTAAQTSGKSVEALGHSAGATGTQMMALQHSVRSVVDSMLAGASPMQAMMQQFGHLQYAASGPGGLTGLFKQIGSGITGFITPARLAFGAIAAGAIEAVTATARYVDGQKEVQQALRGMGRASGMTVDAVNNVAEASAKAGQVSVASARSLAAEYLKTGKIGSDSLGGLVSITQKYADATGQDLGDAQKELAAAFADPIKGVDALNDKLGAYNAKQRDVIQTLAAEGQAEAARAEMIKGLSPILEKSSASLGLFAGAWRDVKNAASEADQALGKSVATMFQAQTAAQRFADVKANYEAAQRSSLFTTGGGNAFGGRNPYLPQDGSKDEPSANPYQEDLIVARNGANYEGLSAQLAGMAERGRQASLAGQNAVNAIFPAVPDTKKLEEYKSALDAALNNKAYAANVSELEAALARVNTQLDAVKAAGGAVALEQQRAADAFSAQLKAVTALTDADREEAAALQAKNAAIASGKSAQEADLAASQAKQLEHAKTVASLQQEIDATKAQETAIRGEISSLSMSTTARARYVAELQKTAELKSQGKNLSSAEAQQLIKEAGELGALNEKLNEHEAAVKKAQSSYEQFKKAREAAWEELQGQADSYNYIKAETDAVGHDDEYHARLLARLQAEGEARRLNKEGLYAEAAAYLDNAEAIGKAQYELRKKQEEEAKFSNMQFQGPAGYDPHVTFGGGASGLKLSITYTPNAEFVKNAKEAIQKAENDRLQAIKDSQSAFSSSMTDAVSSAISDLEGKIDAAKSQATNPAPNPDPYAAKNPTYFYNPAGGAFKENDYQNNVLKTLQDQLDELKKLQSTIDAGGNATAIGTAVAKALQDAGFTSQAKQVTDAQGTFATAQKNLPKTMTMADAWKSVGGGDIGGIKLPSMDAFNAKASSFKDLDTSLGFNLSTMGFASGGDFTVPGPAGVDRPYLVGLAGGERVKIDSVTPANINRTGNDNGTSVDQTFILQGGADPNVLRKSMGEYAREARRGMRAATRR